MAPETPKGVSSRLLTMKFMQRAAASSAASSPGTDVDSTSAKKRKLTHEAAQNKFNAEIDQASIQAAIHEREAKRLAGLEKHGSAADTHWTLPANLDRKKAEGAKKKALRVVYVGYGDHDSSDDAVDDPQFGRMTTSKYKTPPAKGSEAQDSLKRKRADREESGENDSSEASADDDEDDAAADDDDDDDDDDSGDNQGKYGDGQDPYPANGEMKTRAQSKRLSRKTSESSIAKAFREKRKTKEVKLSKLTSISASSNSGGGSGGGGDSSYLKNMKCYTCKQMGHKSGDCPTKSAARRSSRN